MLFLNNAINHGVLGPLGVAEAAENGKSILFMLETNPGPGLGMLLAYLLVRARSARARASPAAMIIQFLGGIHEIYFPYVLMKPRLILAMIAGGAAGVATFMVTGAGLVATPSPGSIFAYIAVTPRGGFVGVLLGIAAVGRGRRFAVAALLLGFGRARRSRSADELERGRTSSPRAEQGATPQPSRSQRGLSMPTIEGSDVQQGRRRLRRRHGSSVMLASQLAQQLEEDGVTVEHTPVQPIPADADVVVCHQGLADRARQARPSTVIVPFQVFLGDPAVDQVVDAIQRRRDRRWLRWPTTRCSTATGRPARADGGRTATTRSARPATLLVESARSSRRTSTPMLERERGISTYVGEGVAIPHGTHAGRGAVHRDALAVLRSPDGVDWDGHEVRVCVAIAAPRRRARRRSWPSSPRS